MAKKKPAPQPGTYTVAPPYSIHHGSFTLWGKDGGISLYMDGSQARSSDLWYRTTTQSDAGVWYHRYSESDRDDDSTMRNWLFEDPQSHDAPYIVAYYFESNKTKITSFGNSTFCPTTVPVSPFKGVVK